MALSIEIGALIGKPVRAPSTVGELRNQLGELFQWRKCPVHDAWLQPEYKPFKHWRCGVTQIDDYFDDNEELYSISRCTFKRSAKLRTAIERRIFTLAWAMDQENT